jgi:hypothetical protein
MKYVIGRPWVDVMDRVCIEDSPLGSPGGAAKIGPLGVDTALVAGMPRAQE